LRGAAGRITCRSACRAGCRPRRGSTWACCDRARA
jgi:hypothetical protein